MTRRKDETPDEYRARHAAEERQRREDPEYMAKIRAHQQLPESKARHAELERERRKTKQAKAYEREYRRDYRERYKEEFTQYNREYYQKNKDRFREAGAAWGRANRDKTRKYVEDWAARNPQRHMFQKIKSSAKARGIEFTLTVEDIAWVTHCPIFGTELCYDRDKKTPHRADYPTIDRWDNSKGYVPGNVFVISWLANRIKWHTDVAQMRAILHYMEVKPDLRGVPVIGLSPTELAPHTRKPE